MDKIVKKIEQKMEGVVKKSMGKIMKPISKTMKFLSKGIKMISKALKMVTKAIKMMLRSLMCSIKLLINFPKCFIFYFLDIIKYTLLYLPILILMGIVGLAKEWKPIQVTLDKYLGWPNSTQNQCYRCKNINKEDLGFFEKLKKMLEKKNGEKVDSTFTFFAFLVVCLFGGAFGYTFWFSFIKK